MGYYSAKESNVLLLATTWMNLKGIKLSEESPKGNTLNDSINVTQLKRHSDGKQMVSRAGEGCGYKKWNFYILIMVVATQI